MENNKFEIISKDFTDETNVVNNNINYMFEYKHDNEIYNKDFVSEACKSCQYYLNSKSNNIPLICHCTLGGPKITC